MCKCDSNKDIYLPLPATVSKVKPMTKYESFFSCRLDSGEELGHMPGQFVEVSIPGIGEAPISVSSSPTRKGSFEMVIRKVGNVSQALHELKDGDKVFIRGPFGTAFPVDDEMKGKDVIFVCGGIGLVPVRSAIQYVLDNRDDYGRVIILFGARTPSDRLFVEEGK
jgi:NAD(P)H-flavin reductase